MMTKEDTVYFNHTINHMPQVLRARGWRLYTKDGNRLVDLWQYGGRALLGHNPPGLLRVIKNNAERGLFAPYPHFAVDRFFKALAVLFPNRVFRIYESESFCYHALNQAQTEAVLWRPFLDKEPQDALLSAPVLLPILPCPFPGAPAVLAINAGVETMADPSENCINHEPTQTTTNVNKKIAAEVRDFSVVSGKKHASWTSQSEKLPASQAISPVALAAATRCIYDLIAADDRGSLHFVKIDKILKQSPIWERRGIYLYYTGADENYGGLFRHFLDGGFLLPPTTEDPAILPGELSAGEEAKLAALINQC